MYRYVMRGIDGSDAGEVCVPHRVRAGDLLADVLRVVTVLEFGELDSSPFEGLLWIEDAHPVSAGFALCLCPGAEEARQPYFGYRLHWADGGEAGEADYVEQIEPGELLWLHDGRQVRVVDVVETTVGKDRGLLMVQPA